MWIGMGKGWDEDGVGTGMETEQGLEKGTGTGTGLGQRSGTGTESGTGTGTGTGTGPGTRPGPGRMPESRPVTRYLQIVGCVLRPVLVIQIVLSAACQPDRPPDMHPQSTQTVDTQTRIPTPS